MDNGDYFILSTAYDLLTYSWSQVFSTYNSPEYFTELYSTSSLAFDSTRRHMLVPFMLRSSHSYSHKIRVFDLDFNETVTDVYL
jgi:hypothetical protein